MAWRGPMSAFRLFGWWFEPLGEVNINATSISIIRDPEWDGSPTLRIFNVTAGDITTGITAAIGDASDYELDMELPACSSPEAGLDVADANICYIDSMTYGAGGREQFCIHPSYAFLQPTCIPRYRYVESYDHLRMSYPLGTVGLHNAPTGVHYGGPEVVRLPDGRWLMVMHRARIVIGAAGGDRDTEYTADPRTFLGDRTSPSASVTDIVAYIADDATFTQNVSGPFWLVDSKDALGTELPQVTNFFGTSSQPARLWLGVPTAAVIGPNIYVYYAYSLSEYLYAFELGVEDDGGDTDTGQYEAAVADLRPGIAAKVIAFDDLLDMEAAASTFVGAALNAEELWEAVQDAGGDPVVPGTLLGKVEIHVETPSGDELFEDAFAPNYYSAYLKLIDPCVVRCGSELALFFGAEWVGGVPPATDRADMLTARGQLWDGLGLWRARSTATTFGKTFEISVTFGTGLNGTRTLSSSDDQVVRSEVTVWEGSPDPADENYGNGRFQNADVVRLADGTYRLQCSAVVAGVAGNVVFRGRRQDACYTGAAAAAIAPTGPLA